MKRLLLIALMLPLLGGCKMMVAKAILGAVVGPEKVAEIDPVARLRRSIINGVTQPDQNRTAAKGSPEPASGLPPGYDTTR